MVSQELENRNAELERLVYTVSHDLKSPLVTIKGFLGLLDRDLHAQDQDRIAEDIGRINNATDTMAILLEDLLELRCLVRDNGRGIAAMYHEQIFGWFERLDAEISGTGIGLALVKRIIEVHGGNVWVESEGIGTGSRFVFTLTSQSNIK